MLGIMKKLTGEHDLPETEQHRRVCQLFYNILHQATFTKENKLFVCESLTALDALQEVIQYERNEQADKAWGWFIDKDGLIDMDSRRYLSLKERRKRLIRSLEICDLLITIAEKANKPLADDAESAGWIQCQYCDPGEFPDPPWSFWHITFNGTLIFPDNRPRHPHRNPQSLGGKRGGSRKVPKGFAKSGKASEAGRKGAEKRWRKK